MPPEVFVLGLLFISLILSSTLSLFKKNSFRINKPTVWGAIVFALLSLLGNYANGKSMIFVSAPVTAVTMRMQIVMVMIMSWILLKEKINIFLWIGSLLTMVGIITMSYTQNGFEIAQSTGIFWALLAAICFATVQVMTKRIIHQIEPISLNILRLLIAVAIFAFLPGRVTMLLELPLEGWLLISIAALFGPTLSRILQMYAIKHMELSSFIIFTMLTPIFALFLSMLILKDLPSIHEIAGGVIILLGIMIPNLKNSQKSPSL